MLEALEPLVLVEPSSVERAVLPRMNLELAGLNGLLHVDACFREPLEMVFPSRWVDEVERPITLLEALFDERVEDAVMLVHPVEERANVAILAESVWRNLKRCVRGFHACHLDSERDAARSSRMFDRRASGQSGSAWALDSETAAELSRVLLRISLVNDRAALSVDIVAPASHQARRRALPLASIGLFLV